MAVAPHVHFSAVHMLAIVAVIVIFFGSAHLIALTHDTPLSRAWIALGF